jgi:DNA-directed DNA polymerase III PolC
VLDNKDIFVLSGTDFDLDELPESDDFFLEINPESQTWNRKIATYDYPKVICAANNFPSTDDRAAYEVVAGRERLSRTTIQHIPDSWELELDIPDIPEQAWANTKYIADRCNVELQTATMISVDWEHSLEDLCNQGKLTRPIIWDEEYEARLKRELDLIEEKNFADYFQLVADMVNEAKKIMIVGPARGSAAGSLVCYLIGITDVDPIKHELMFERFIDITREDLPDIDIDFQDTKREEIITYLGHKYGPERVGRIGTVMRYKAKSALGDTAAALNVPKWEVKDVSEAVLERSGGDARAQFCVQDALETLDIGKALLEKHPEMSIAGIIEGHAKTTGKHAAGVLVCNRPITHYCAVGRNEAVQIDKHDAESLGMLKIDCLGLRTLSVIDSTLELIGKPYDWLLEYPLEDKAAFEVFNEERFSGIFQFEGYALKALTKQMGVHRFDDIAAITALARPGPLHCGAANDFVMRRTGKEPVTHLHPLIEHITEPTFGTIVYQEQVMAISREFGRLSWEDVSALRKAMSKSMGEEFFNKFWEKFRDGAYRKHGIKAAEARHLWDRMCTFGSWAFNKSHAVSYGLISYYCAVLKAHYPLEFAAGSLQNQPDDEKAVRLLREVVAAGYEFEPYDSELSDVNWTVRNGKLIGGFRNIKGIGEITAKKIVEARENGGKPSPGQAKKLIAGETPFDDIFGCERRWGDYYLHPERYKVKSGKVWHIQDIDKPGEYVFIGRLMVKNLRDMNEYQSVVKRGGRIIKRYSLFLNLTVEDDTGSIIIQISRYKYPQIGKRIMEETSIGDWFLWKGRITDEWRIVRVDKVRWLEDPDAVVVRETKAGGVRMDAKLEEKDV